MDKVWRGYARWLVYADRWSVTDHDVPKLFNEDPMLKQESAYELNKVVLLPAADYDALTQALADAKAELTGVCETCKGEGLMEVLARVLPPDEREEYEAIECAECNGTGKGWIASLITERNTLRAENATLRAELAEAQAAYKRLEHDMHKPGA